MSQRSSELKNVTYEIFIGILSLLSIANLALYYLVPGEDVKNVVAIMDSLLTLIFLSDFLYRFFTAESKSKYFIRQFGWADLLASMPFPQFKLLRIFRVVRAWRMMRAFGPVGIFKEFVSSRAQSTLLTLLLLVMLLLEFGSMLVLSFEQYAPSANIQSGADAVWYTFVTITTVGYGDRFPTTHGGRFFGMVIMAIGVGVFGTLTGYLSNFFLSGPSGESAEVVAIHVVEDETLAADDGGAQATIAGLRRLLAEQQAAHDALSRKIDELETRL